MHDHSSVSYKQPIALGKKPANAAGEPTRIAVRTLRSAGSLAGFVVALLMPKCPLCVAAVLSGFGFGAAAAALLAPYLRPALYALSLAAFVALVFRERARSARRVSVRACPCNEAVAERTAPT